ncbi:MAG: hypothetical protein SF029_07855 [bacterium]|nr:hypothetical protein [bacterium]
MAPKRFFFAPKLLHFFVFGLWLAATLTVTAQRPTPTPFPPPPGGAPSTGIPFRVYVNLTGGDIRSGANGTLSLYLVGSRGTGCNLPLLVDQRIEGTTLVIEVFEEVSPAQTCPAMLILLDETLTVQPPDALFTDIIINGFLTEEREDDVYFILPEPANPEATSDALGGGSGEMPIMPQPSRIPYVIEEVTLTPQSRTTLALQISGYAPDGCDFPPVETISYLGGWASIGLFREVPADVMCPMNVLPFEYTVTLDLRRLIESGRFIEDVAYTHYAIEINDYVALLTIDFAELIPTERQLMEVDAVEVLTLESFPPQTALQISGINADGCVLPIRARVVPAEQGQLNVEVYRPSPGRLNCPINVRAWTYNFTYLLEPSPTLPPGSYRYHVNGVEGVLEISGSEFPATLTPFPPPAQQMPGTPTPPPSPRGGQAGGNPTAPPLPRGARATPPSTIANRAYHVINDVDVLIMESFPPSAPPQVSLEITGYIPDGCTAETQLVQRQTGNTITIELYRELPPDAMCPMVISDYQENIALGALRPGRYTINVNGYVVTAEIR